MTAPPPHVSRSRDRLRLCLRCLYYHSNFGFIPLHLRWDGTWSRVPRMRFGCLGCGHRYWVSRTEMLDLRQDERTLSFDCYV